MRRRNTVIFLLLALTALYMTVSAAAAQQEPGFEVDIPEKIQVEEPTLVEVELQGSTSYDRASVRLSVGDGRRIDEASFQNGRAELTLRGRDLNLPGNQTLVFEVSTYSETDGWSNDTESKTVHYSRFVQNFDGLMVPPTEDVREKIQEVPGVGGNGSNVYIFSNVNDTDLYVVLSEEVLEPGRYNLTGFQYPTGEVTVDSGHVLCIYGSWKQTRHEDQPSRISNLEAMEAAKHGDIYEFEGHIVEFHRGDELYIVKPTAGERGTLAVSSERIPPAANATIEVAYVDRSVHRHYYQTTYSTGGRQPYLYVTDVRGGENPPDANTLRDRVSDTGGNGSIDGIQNEGVEDSPGSPDGRDSRDDENSQREAGEDTPLRLTTVLLSIVVTAYLARTTGRGD